MPTNFLHIEACLPIKHVPSTANPGMHFDDSWACEQIRSWEREIHYRQKWVKTDTTPLQIRTTIVPGDYKIYNTQGIVVKTIAWTVTDLVIYKICELTFDISDLAEGVYVGYFQVTAGAINWKVLTEPIHSKTSWPNTRLITYKNSFNAQGITFTTGIEFKFRAEVDVIEMTPEADRSAYVDQPHKVFGLYGTPWRSFKLGIGTTPGVAPYIVDIINRIFCMDTISIEGKKYQRAEGAKMEINRAKGYPLVGGSLEIVEAENDAGVHFAHGTEEINGLVTAYNQDTDFFGSGSGVEIIDITQ
jgi:hypothetical protein